MRKRNCWPTFLSGPRIQSVKDRGRTEKYLGTHGHHPHDRPTRSKIIRARVTLSDTTAVRRGEGRLMSGSRARRTAAMIAAVMTSVDFIRVCSCIVSVQASRSRAIARFISPIRAPLISRVSGQVCTTACRERSQMEDSFSSLRKVDTALQSRCPVSYPLALGCSHRTSCSGS